MFARRVELLGARNAMHRVPRGALPSIFLFSLNFLTRATNCSKIDGLLVLEIINNNFILLNDVDIFNEIITRLIWCVFFVSWGVSFREYGVKATTPATPWTTLV